MKKFTLAALLSIVALAQASATPYFRVIGRPGYQKQVLSEACFDPNSHAAAAITNCTSIPLVEHRWQDGHLLIPNEDWALVTVGGAFGNGQKLFTVGPAANLAPTMKAGLLQALNYLTKDDQAVNLKSLLAPAPSSNGVDLTINLGVKFGYEPTVCHGGKGLLLLSIGPALSF